MPSADYMSEYRKRNQQYVAEQNKRKRAKEKADRRLRAQHPADWMVLYKEELEKEGIQDA